MGWKTNTGIMLKYFILNIVSCYLYAIVAKMYQLFWLFFFFSDWPLAPELTGELRDRHSHCNSPSILT